MDRYRCCNHHRSVGAGCAEVFLLKSDVVTSSPKGRSGEVCSTASQVQAFEALALEFGALRP
jgi:hypothetical protein